MQIMLVLALIFALAVAVFAVQNAEPITVQFLQWQSHTSLVVVILAAAALGALSAGLAGTVRQVSLKLRIRSLQGQLQKMEKELAALREDKVDLQQELARLEAELAQIRQSTAAAHEASRIRLTPPGDLPASPSSETGPPSSEAGGSSSSSHR